ncbi:hypothetical protein GCM10011374_02720 [Kocuria dechangensis]|uniref:Uncharacterized protein n=1 Tax=Kocuria dechangensis TaxID=1176249 RepID=A0A917GGC0_9MICC|nr:hypothetical protein GCM10011374_02720 [Kocuria dechangensis]
MAPNMATPTNSPATVVRLKLVSRNRCIGMMGSAVRRSTATKEDPATRVPATRPRMTGSVHSYLLPPQVANSTRQVVATASSSIPPTSRRGRPVCRGRCRKRTAPARASSPRGC